MKSILIIEDEINISDFIKMELEHEGHNADVCGDGKEGLELALNKSYDLIILDLMLPTLNGLEVCRRLKKAKDTPIIMLSAKDTVMDKVSGLQIGAEDYISKPFAIEELLARIQVVFRREERNSLGKINFKDLIIDQGTRTVYKDNEEIQLTNKEYELFMLLLNNKNQVLPRNVILERIWGYNYEIETNVVDVYIKYLRNKLYSKNKEEYIQTVRSVGYIMRS